jgi:pimeloyl-ACP methyl ester carboxylesterase
MPTAELNGAKIHYEDTGSGDETIVFAHGLLWSGAMYGPQVAALRGRFRCVTFDFRGQGGSETTPDGYDMDSLTADAIALIEMLGVAPVHFVGLSMGGFVAMRVAARRPDLVRSVALLETSAEVESRDKILRYRLLGAIGRYLGFGLVAGSAMPIMFGKTFMTDPARKAERETWRSVLLKNDRVGISRALGGVIGRASVEAELANIVAPALVIVGEEDVATVPAKAEAIARAIAHATLVRIPRAGHTSTLEEPAAVTAALEQFLSSVSPPRT